MLNDSKDVVLNIGCLVACRMSISANTGARCRGSQTITEKMAQPSLVLGLD